MFLIEVRTQSCQKHIQRLDTPSPLRSNSVLQMLECARKSLMASKFHLISFEIRQRQFGNHLSPCGWSMGDSSLVNPILAALKSRSLEHEMSSCTHLKARRAGPVVSSLKADSADVPT